MSGVRDVACPKCGANPNEPCRTLTTGRVTDLHEARCDAFYLPRPAPGGVPDTDTSEEK
jgi:hypothetical protein